MTPVPSRETIDHDLAAASRTELIRAEALYDAYSEAVGGVSAVTGAKLPAFDDCPPMVRYGWLRTAQRNPPVVARPQAPPERVIPERGA